MSNADPEVTIDDPDDGDLFGTAETVNLSASFTDVGSNDTHICTIDWGDTTIEAGTVDQDADTCTGSHTYASGNYTITVTLTDDDGGFDTDSVDIVVNDPPEVDAGGPYTGEEGSDIALDGTATDDDGDTLTLTWTYEAGLDVDAGASCEFSDETIEDPTFTCTDDGTFTVTLTADDGVNDPVSDSATVTVSNADPEVTIDDPDDGDLFGTAETVNLSASFTDVGSNDTHICTIDWGDTTIEAGTVDQDADTCTGSHTYASGNYTITVTLTDDDGGFDTDSVDIVVNDPPEVDAGGPYTGEEGSDIALDGTATDDDGDTLTLTWTYEAGLDVDAGASCEFSDETIEDPTFTCTDDGTFTVTLTADDGVNDPVSDSATVTVSNADPVVGPVTAPASPVLINSVVSASAPFTDAGSNDTHTCTIDWGDGFTTNGFVTETPGSGSGTCSGSHAYTAQGIYTITITVTDDDGGSGDSSFQYVVVYDPEGGFVTGGGWINSPVGASTDFPTATGRANFGFVSKYQKGASIPTGNTEFQFHAGDLNFKSTVYEWLVISGSHRAQYKGSGRINGSGDYGFMLTAIDGDKKSPAQPDRFRIRIWNKATGAVVYDNQVGTGDNADLTTGGTLVQGSIVIHVPKK